MRSFYQQRADDEKKRSFIEFGLKGLKKDQLKGSME